MLFFDDVVELVVLVDRGNDDDVLEVFGSGTNQRDSSDVDLFDDGLFFGTRSDGLFERIEVDDHRVDFGNLILSGLFLVLRVVATGQNTAEHFGVQGLDASSENRRITRQALYRGGLQPQTLDKREGSSG